MNLKGPLFSGRLHAPLLLIAVLLAAGHSGLAQAPAGTTTWDQGKSVYNRRVRPPEAPTNIDWNGRITATAQGATG